MKPGDIVMSKHNDTTLRFIGYVTNVHDDGYVDYVGITFRSDDPKRAFFLR